MAKEDKRASIIQRSYELSGVIRPSMDQSVSHRPEDSLARDIHSLMGEKSYDAAHNTLDNNLYGSRVKVKMPVSSLE
jgi:hypothetical protein